MTQAELYHRNRKIDILYDRRSGLSAEEVAEKYNISRPRVSQILKKVNDDLAVVSAVNWRLNAGVIVTEEDEEYGELDAKAEAWLERARKGIA